MGRWVSIKIKLANQIKTHNTIIIWQACMPIGVQRPHWTWCLLTLQWSWTRRVFWSHPFTLGERTIALMEHIVIIVSYQVGEHGHGWWGGSDHPQGLGHRHACHHETALWQGSRGLHASGQATIGLVEAKICGIWTVMLSFLFEWVVVLFGRKKRCVN